MQVVDRGLLRPCLRLMKSSTMPDCSGPGPEQRDERDDVLEAVGLQAPDQILHAARLELEHRRGAHRT